MKTTIGSLVLGTALLALFLYTCTGPGDEAVGPVGAGVQDKRTSDVDDTPPPIATERGTPDAPRPEARPRPGATGRPQASIIADATETPGLNPAGTLPHPVPNVEVLLAVRPRDLEGGSGSGLLLPVDTLRAALRIPMPSRDGLPTAVTRGQPASTINTPTAFGQRLGDVFAGLAYQDRIRYDDWRDGVASVGIGIGDPVTVLGVDVAANILDTYTDVAQDRSVSIKLHRRLPFRSAVAVGHENLWHTPGTDGGSSRYVVVSKVVLVRDQPTSALGSLVLNLGLGNDRFLPEDRFAQGDGGVNAFGSVAVRVLPPMNVIGNWTGQDLALGVSIAPIRRWPLVVTPALVDVTGSAGDGARFSMSAGLNYRFGR